jgi:hypothetical protein
LCQEEQLRQESLALCSKVAPSLEDQPIISTKSALFVYEYLKDLLSYRKSTGWLLGGELGEEVKRGIAM